MSAYQFFNPRAEADGIIRFLLSQIRGVGGFRRSRNGPQPKGRNRRAAQDDHPAGQDGQHDDGQVQEALHYRPEKVREE